MNLGAAGDGALGFAAGRRVGWRGCRRGGSPEGRAGAATAGCAPSGPVVGAVGLTVFGRGDSDPSQ